MSKKTDSETVDLATATPETPIALAADPASPIPGTVEQTLATPPEILPPPPPPPQPPTASPAAAAEPEPLIECVALHGRLTHEGKTYAPHEKVFLPAELARGLIAAGHVAKAGKE